MHDRPSSPLLESAALLPGVLAALAAGSAVGRRVHPPLLAVGCGAVAGAAATWFATPPPRHRTSGRPRAGRPSSSWSPDAC